MNARHVVASVEHGAHHDDAAARAGLGVATGVVANGKKALGVPVRSARLDKRTPGRLNVRLASPTEVYPGSVHRISCLRRDVNTPIHASISIFTRGYSIRERSDAAAPQYVPSARAADESASDNRGRTRLIHLESSGEFSLSGSLARSRGLPAKRTAPQPDLGFHD